MSFFAPTLQSSKDRDASIVLSAFCFPGRSETRRPLFQVSVDQPAHIPHVYVQRM